MLTYNSVSKLGKLFNKILEGLLHIDYEDVHIIIADNASNDNTFNYIRKFLANHPCKHTITVLRLKRNYGWAGGNNRAAILFKDTDYLLFLNDDLMLKPDVSRKLVEAMEQNPDIGAIQPVIINFNGTYNLGYYLSLGLMPCPITAYNVPTHRQRNGLLEVAYAMGAALMTRTELFFRLGMFDEGYFYWFDDVDYSLRVWAAGYRVACVLDCFVYHVGSATLGKTNPLLQYYFSRNLLLLLTKLPLAVIFNVLPFAIIEWIFNTLLHYLKVSDMISLAYSLLGIKHYLKTLSDLVGNTRKIPLTRRLLRNITSPYITAKNIKLTTRK